MKVNHFIALGLLCVASTGYSQSESEGNSASATASARIVRPVKITPIRPLNFGSLVRGASGEGTATMAPVTTVGDVAPSTGVGLTALAQGSTDDYHPSSRGPATFLIQGEPNFMVTVTLPSNEPVFMINREDNPDDMLPVTNFTMSSPSVMQLTLANSNAVVGTARFSVGATVTVPHNTTSGWYNGQFNVVVTYN